MTEPAVEPLTPTDALMDALVAFTADVCGPLGVCSYGLTIGEAYVPFDPDLDDEECEDSFCEQAWVRVANIGIANSSLGFGGEDGGVPQYVVEVGILRCIEPEEDGEAPKASDMLAAATQAMIDMNTIYCAAVASQAFEYLAVGQWTPMGPAGAQYGGTWIFQVEI